MENATKNILDKIKINKIAKEEEEKKGGETVSAGEFVTACEEQGKNFNHTQKIPVFCKMDVISVLLLFCGS